MFTRRFSFVMAFLLAFIALGIAPAKAGERTPFTVDSMDWIDGAYTNERVVGTNWQIDFNGVIGITASDARMSGIMTVSWSCTVKISTDEHPVPKPNAIWGPCEGKWSMNTDADAESEWAGNISVLPQNTTYTVANFFGHGQSEYKGLQVKVTQRQPETPEGTYSFVGEILDPKAK